MNNKTSTNLVVNESYWSFFDGKTLKTQAFLSPKLKNLLPENYSITKSAKGLGVLMQQKDSNNKAIYGVEIKPDGSRRPGRIQLVRWSPLNQSIWKIAPSLKDVERGITELNKYVYFLSKSRPNEKFSLPFKVLLATFSETSYTDGGKYQQFIVDKVEKDKIIFISLDFLKDVLSFEEPVDFDKLLSNEGAIITKEAAL